MDSHLNWYTRNPQQEKEYQAREEKKRQQEHDYELRLARGERSFALGFNGGTWDD